MTKTMKGNREKKYWQDPFVAEMRRNRENHASEFHYDMTEITQDIYRRREQLMKEGWTFYKMTNVTE
ncbi:MAG: hypothetical protein ACRC10_02455 [Thermoguttaceae bacterium]